MTERKQFYQQMLYIAIPVALQSLITTSLNTLDTMMISSLGDAALAGVGLANQVFFFFIMICFGISSGSSVIISQYWGKKDVHHVRLVNGMATILCCLFGVLFTLAAQLFPQQLMGLMIKDPEVIAQGAAYMRMVSWSYVLTGVSFAYGTSLRSTGNPRTPLVASIVSFFFNAFFNYAFIFGAFGFPRLEVVGAAVGTIIARLAECGIIVWITYRYSGPLNTSWRNMVKFDREFLQKYKTTTSPVVINETFWAFGQILYSVAYAMIGREATAAIQVSMAIQNIAFIIVRGLGSSCTIMIGNTIGKGQMDYVYRYAVRFLKLSLITGLVVGGIMSLTPSITLQLFGNLSESVYYLATRLLGVMGIIFLLKAYNSVLVVGVLRGGGDTQYSMYLEMGTVWLIGVPLAFIGAGVLHLPVYWVICFAAMEEVFKAIIGTYRVYSRRWIHTIA